MADIIVGELRKVVIVGTDRAAEAVSVIKRDYFVNQAFEMVNGVAG